MEVINIIPQCTSDDRAAEIQKIYFDLQELLYDNKVKRKEARDDDK